MQQLHTISSESIQQFQNKIKRFENDFYRGLRSEKHFQSCYSTCAYLDKKNFKLALEYVLLV